MSVEKDVWVLYTDMQYDHIKRIASDGYWKLYDEFKVQLKLGDQVYIYTQYLSKIRFKANVALIDENFVLLEIKETYRGRGLKDLTSVLGDSQPERRSLYRISDEHQVKDMIESEFRESKFKTCNPTSSKKTDNQDAISIQGIVIVSIIIIILICLVLFVDSLLFGVCAIVGLSGMTIKALFNK